MQIVMFDARKLAQMHKNASKRKQANVIRCAHQNDTELCTFLFVPWNDNKNTKKYNEKHFRKWEIKQNNQQEWKKFKYFAIFNINSKWVILLSFLQLKT